MHAAVDRHARSATLVATARCDDDFLVHPFLAAPAAVFAWWEGREALHGGAFISGGGCFALLGDKAAGKSSTLAQLARRGHPVLCDDLLVVRATTTLAGPRCLDLRPAVTERLGIHAQTRELRSGKRRLPLPPAPAEVALRGFFFLAWGERIEARPLAPSERLPRLAASRTIGGSRGSPVSLLELAGLPAWELRRPRVLDSIEPAADRLLTLVGAGAEPSGVER